MIVLQVERNVKQFVPGSKVIWRNAGSDIPATITACLGAMGGENYYSILQFDGFASPGGVPESQLVWDDGLDFTLDDVAERNPDPAPAPKFVNPFTPAHHLLLLKEALKLAALGRYVVPLHEPIFDDAGVCVGCTCEAYKRSQKYQQWLKAKHDDGKLKHKKYDPNFKCRTPGKHPRLSDWEEKASIDPAQIRRWWNQNPTANLGVTPGKSDLLVLDADKYKDDYAGADLLSQDDEQTATTLTGNGGQHFWYQMPEGAQYGNEVGELPEGIDIRGFGGMVLVYPSIHPNGNRYEWEDGYNLTECPPIPLPQALKAILDAAQAKAPKQAVTFTTPTTQAPDLRQWIVSIAVRDLIAKPAPVGERSEADYKVCLSLVYAGATDDDILAVFEHHPIGTQGKFAEAGRGYLARTIGRARAFATANPRPDVQATIEPIQLWIRTHSFEGRVPVSSNGIYYTDSTDTKVANAVCMAMRADRRLVIHIGKKRLAKLAGVSPNTALKALTRLNGWLFDVTPEPIGARVALVENCRLHQIDPSLAVKSVLRGGQTDENDKITDEYSPRMANDMFLNGTSRHVKQEMKDVASALDITDKEALEQFTFKGFGETGLRIIDAMLRVGADMTMQELVDETGKKPSAIRLACSRLLQHGLMEATREGSTGPKVYGLADNIWQRLEAVAPHLRNYKLSAQREDRRLVASIQWAQMELKTAQPEDKKRLDWRIANLSAQRIPILTDLHDDMPADEIKRLAYDVTIPFGPHPSIQAKLERLHATAKMDVAEAKRAAQWQLTKTAQQLRADGDSKKGAVHKLTLAGYTTNEAWNTVKHVWSVVGVSA